MRRAIVAATAVIGAIAAAPAPAQDPGQYQVAKFRFTSPEPGASSGLVLRVDYQDPGDPAAKPPAVRTVVETLARGASFDTSVPALCPASDAELMLLGPAACPPDSVVGDGMLTLDTGLPQPGRYVASPVDFLNNTHQLIFLNHVAATETPRVVTRAQVGERRRVSMAPFLPGTLPDGTVVDTVLARDFAVSDGPNAYVTTPPTCPKRGYWVNRAEFTYADGVTQTVTSRSRCER